MIYKKFITENTLGCILPNSIILNENGTKLKIHKGSKITPEIIKLLIKNKVEEINCLKLEEHEIDENAAAEKISKSFISKNQKVFAYKNFMTGRCNIVARKNGIFYYDEKKITALNNISPTISIAAINCFTKVKKGQNLATIKIIPFAINKNDFEKFKKAASNSFKIAIFKKIKVHVIQTYNSETKPSLLEKTKLVTQNRLKDCGMNNISESRIPNDETNLNSELKKQLKNSELILIFGVQAISDINHLISQCIIKNNGKIMRIGMPVEPGNLILISSIKKNNKNIFVIGMPSCARSIKENGADWIIWRILSGLNINNDIIDKMGVGGLLK